jgi:mono/diheme cytochrome c family protein
LAGNPNATDPAYVAEVIANGRTGPLEVDGVSYDSAMPAIGALSGADLDAVVDYVTGIAGAEEVEPSDGEVIAAPIVGDSNRGHDLFRGSASFDQGAPACAACHTAGAVSNLGGSSLGPDLTNALDVVGGEAGFVGWMANPPAETMAPLFKDHPLNEQELADVAAYLSDTPNQDRASGPDRLLLAALIGTAVLIGGMAFFWRGMRQTYVERLRSK